MIRWALVMNGVCITVVEQSAAPAQGGDWVQSGASPVGPGWRRVNGAWSEPTVTPEPRYITRLAFISRFTDAEAIAIDLASQGSTQQAAAMRRYQDKIKTATYIDLGRQDTRDGVQALQTVGLLVTGRPAQILDAAVQPHERYSGG